MNDRLNKNILFVCFVLSGFSGLADQLVWARLAYARFGINAQVLSIVLSVFMLGLLLGALAGAGFSRWAAAKLGIPSLGAYALAELVIAFGALLVPKSFALGRGLLLSSGGMDSLSYLTLSALVMAFSMLPFCTAMGMTYPLAMGHLRQLGSRNERESTFSFLYVANVLGALAGTVLTALILVEVAGLSGCLKVAFSCNMTAALLSGWLSLRTLRKKSVLSSASVRSRADGWMLWVLFWTGFASMGMEVVWTRAFTPVLKTQVYSFAALLATYLVATFLGSIVYRQHQAKGRHASFLTLMGWLSLASILPVLLNDPRIHYSPLGVLFSIVPFCGILGYLTPLLVDQSSKGSPAAAGRAYALNLLGCILGPLTAGYLLLPTLGAKTALLLFAMPLFAILVTKAWIERPSRVPVRFLTTVNIVLLMIASLYSWSFEEFFYGCSGIRQIRRDYTASVVSCGKGMEKSLYVNGVGITSLTTITKYMAHLPFVALGRPAESALVICLGMGTSFRSCLSWGVDTTAVELVPSVRDALSYYFEDLADWKQRKGAKIVVDDGRRYLERTPDQYDVITIDPPPPVEAAGSSLLYSVEFYRCARRHLKPGGILQQWYPGNGELPCLEAMARSLAESFPCVTVLPSCESWGFHFLASDTPIHLPDGDQAMRFMPPSARSDLSEWLGEQKSRVLFKKVLRQGKDISIMVHADPRLIITDDRPYNEYFLLRRLFRNNDL